ncbi:hypothetical protein E2C01_036886 [Portunus trituberculatus]|uniref:Uncharacterized protein n=1 Tax=Portunus trituberculatus TaxID=210409 RepID=A0A5B7FCL8_PORTR|nr:hypothetical protein [Portunus trituberculatus]
MEMDERYKVSLKDIEIFSLTDTFFLSSRYESLVGFLGTVHEGIYEPASHGLQHWMARNSHSNETYT